MKKYRKGRTVILCVLHQSRPGQSTSPILSEEEKIELIFVRLLLDARQKYEVLAGAVSLNLYCKHLVKNHCLIFQCRHLRLS